MKNNFFAILLSLIISIGCTQETVINANIDEKLNNSGPTLKVQIKTENSRTIRPEVTKWEIKLFESNEQLTTRVLHGKDNTVTTFTNVTVGNYTVKVTGKSEDDCKILYGEEVVEITSNETEMCVVTVNDNFETQSSENPNGTLSVNISGLEALQLDVFEAKFTLKLTTLSINDGNTVDEKEVDLVYESGKLSGKDDSIPVGSYKIENISFVHTDALPTGEAGDSAAIDVLPINLIQDPIVNIYPGTTTYINWTWKYSKENQPGIKEEITQNNILKNTLVPVWNKPVFNPDYYQAESSVPAKNGSLSANALFAEPTWDEGQCSFEYKSDDGSTISATVNKDELEFINCTYDGSGNLWILSGTSMGKDFLDESGNSKQIYRYCYVLKNVSTGDEYNVTTGEYNATADYYEKMLQDFAVATVEGQKYLLCITDTVNGNNIKSFKIEGEIVNIPNGNVLELGIGIDDYNVTALYAKDKKIYIAITVTNSGETGDNTTANIYTGIINEKGELASFGEDNQPEPLLSLGISDFTNGTIQNDYFNNSAFMISDMYIDNSKLYVTAGCVNYQGNAWNNQQGGRVYHSFGGLFVYELDEAGNLKKDDDGSITVESYGINNNEITTIDPETENDIDPNPFLTTGGEGILELEENIMQAVANDSQYFAGPRYIIPAGKDLLIVDSGFYGVYSGEKKRLIYCEKRNRIFTYNITENGLSFNSITKVDDSISFDYDYLVNSDKIE